MDSNAKKKFIMINNRFNSHNEREHTEKKLIPSTHKSIQLEEIRKETGALLNANQFRIACGKSHSNRNDFFLIWLKLLCLIRIGSIFMLQWVAQVKSHALWAIEMRRKTCFVQTGLPCIKVIKMSAWAIYLLVSSALLSADGVVNYHILILILHLEISAVILQ